MTIINPAFLVLALLVLVFLAFIREKYSPDIVALSSVAVLLALGIIDTKEFLSIFSNSAPITIAFMFIISAALERTGCLQTLGAYIARLAGKSYLRVMLVVMLPVMFVSAFMNNTPVVILMTPIVISIAHSSGVSSSKMLIPLSFAAIFGGSATLIGTSTNILVGGIVAERGLPAIGMFEMTIPALIFASFGMVYMVIFSRLLLPDRHSLSSILEGQEKRQFLAEVIISEGSKYIDKQVSDIKEISKKAKIIDIIRDRSSVLNLLEELKLQKGDRLIIEANAGEVLGLKENGHFDFSNVGSNDFTLSAKETVILEGSLNPNSAFIGKRVDSLNLRSKYGVYILAVHRGSEERRENSILSILDFWSSGSKEDLKNAPLKFGDTLLIEGSAENIAKLLDEGSIINLAAPQEKPLRKEKAPVALLTIVSVMVLSAFEIFPIAGLAFIGAVVVLFSGCVDTEDAYNSIDWRILFLIFGMLGLSLGMEKTGAMKMIVETVFSLVQNMSPAMILAIIYVLTSLLTEMMSNNAVAVLLAPIVIALSQQLGLDSRPFIMAVMFAASASFATPIGYQTNTFVYGAGGYKFIDFLKIGVPLNIIFAVLATIVLPIFFPF